MNNAEDPLIQINWSKIKRHLGSGLSKIGRPVKRILIIILKLLTKLLIVLRKIYLRLRKFAKSKHLGIWILLFSFLFFIFLITSIFLYRQSKARSREYLELKQKHEIQLEEHQDLMEKKYELEKKLEELENNPPVIYRYKSQGLSPEIKQIIAKYADEYGVSQSLVECIIMHESGGNPEAVSPSGEYVGLAQYCLSTFLAHRRYLGLSEKDLRTNPDASVQLLVAALARGEGGHWPTAYPACS